MAKAGSESPDASFALKIVLSGESGVGKTNLLLRFARGHFNSESKSTIGVEFATKTVQINNQTVKANIWDTAGQEMFRAVTSTYYRGAHGAMVVYDITSSTSFRAAGKWLAELRAHADPNIPIMLVGNKADLNEMRAVTIEEGQNLAEREHLLFIETSAKTAANTNEAFTQLLTEIMSGIANAGLGPQGAPHPKPVPGLAVVKPAGGCC
jgi:Ras-related protein Rab-11A